MMSVHTQLTDNYVNTSIKPMFQLSLLPDNRNRDIEVVEVGKMDFGEVKRHLEKKVFFRCV